MDWLTIAFRHKKNPNLHKITGIRTKMFITLNLPRILSEHLRHKKKLESSQNHWHTYSSIIIHHRALCMGPGARRAERKKNRKCQNRPEMSHQTGSTGADRKGQNRPEVGQRGPEGRKRTPETMPRPGRRRGGPEPGPAVGRSRKSAAPGTRTGGGGWGIKSRTVWCRLWAAGRAAADRRSGMPFQNKPRDQ